MLLPELRPRWQRLLLRGYHWVAAAFSVSLAASLATLPLIAYYFHLFTPVSLAANLVVVPLSGLALMCGLGSIACAAWLPAAAELFNHAGWFFMWLMVHISRWMASLPGAYWQILAPGALGLVFYYGALGALRWRPVPRTRRRWLWGCLAVVGAAWMAGNWRESATARVTVLPLRGGHAVWANPPGREPEWLVDCGDAFSAERVTLPFLRAQGMNRLSRLILTHGDVRHTGGLTNLLAELPTDRLYTADTPFLSQPYRRGLAAWTRAHGPPVLLAAGQAAGPWEVLHPDPANAFPQADDKALVLRTRFHGARLLLCAELGHAGQSALLQRHADLEADIVVSGLPAAGEPLRDALLDAIRPRLIVIADDLGRVGAQARPALQSRLERRGAPVLFTRHSRAVTLVFRDSSIRVQTMEGNPFDLPPRPSRP